ncbi:class II fructose-bisphosphate aldolase [Deinococcus marmoris]|uniref:Fructose-bisphosphate aldolase class II n=1 Tax=Deinococcus marmoris TaxID=249408 RepID=A0A1U7P390_9DEIO|nr:class II fructose-bisphosphate aldolase [Deinococcus marmoris]OLV19643.1 Fructose-bisphosphate aldolase class II [Deinococcus marmoris]
MTVAAPQTSADIIRAARAGGYALAAFNAVNLETAQAIVRAAEATRAPVILQFSQNAARHGGLAQLAALGLSLKSEAGVPILLHFDHAEDEGMALEALNLGFDGVMLEGDDPATLRRLADAANAAGGYFEAEYEVVVKGERSGERHDDPAHLAAFIRDSGCDLLAVDIGSAHKQESKNAHLDFDRLTRLAELTTLPLVLHGASSVPEAELARATGLGIAKVNLATDLTLAFTAAVREALDAGARDPRNYLGAGRDAMQARAETYIRALGGAGRA